MTPRWAPFSEAVLTRRLDQLSRAVWDLKPTPLSSSTAGVGPRLDR